MKFFFIYIFDLLVNIFARSANIFSRVVTYLLAQPIFYSISPWNMKKSKVNINFFVLFDTIMGESVYLIEAQRYFFLHESNLITATMNIIRMGLSLFNQIASTLSLILIFVAALYPSLLKVKPPFIDGNLSNKSITCF